jgi:hypothetical protein
MIPLDYWIVQIENIFHPQYDGQDRHELLTKLLKEILKPYEGSS